MDPWTIIVPGKKLFSLLTKAVGEFRDYNGGLLIKRQEQLHSFKENFSKSEHYDSELLDPFFMLLCLLQNK